MSKTTAWTEDELREIEDQRARDGRPPEWQEGSIRELAEQQRPPTIELTMGEDVRAHGYPPIDYPGPADTEAVAREVARSLEGLTLPHAVAGIAGDGTVRVHLLGEVDASTLPWVAGIIYGETIGSARIVTTASAVVAADAAAATRRWPPSSPAAMDEGAVIRATMRDLERTGLIHPDGSNRTAPSLVVRPDPSCVGQVIAERLTDQWGADPGGGGDRVALVTMARDGDSWATVSSAVVEPDERTADEILADMRMAIRRAGVR